MSPLVWSIAGWDDQVLRGSLADIQTFKAFRVSYRSIICSLTLQDTNLYRWGEPIGSDALESQLLQAYQIARPSWVKIGLLLDINTIQLLASFFKKHPIPIVLDPILGPSFGQTIYTGSMKQALICDLLPLVTVLTPNLQEAKWLTDSTDRYGPALLDMGPKSVVVKSVEKNKRVYDVCYEKNKKLIWIGSNYLKLDRPVPGTGCRFSAALTAMLAKNKSITQSMLSAKRWVIRDFSQTKQPFPHCGLLENESFLQLNKPLGLYAIVSTLKEIELLSKLGVTTFQLRIKDENLYVISNEIRESVLFCKEQNLTLFVNDYWELAIEHHASGVHVGQDDLMACDLKALRAAGLRLGVSTHSQVELATALRVRPSYIALGPIFKTNSKQMPYSPQGLARLKQWKRWIQQPLVAIGGINERNFMSVLCCKPDGIAMISGLKVEPHVIRYYIQAIERERICNAMPRMSICQK
ncbi:MAG: thiamine phosphate synthase [Gammaproteobacteria bacterium]